MREMDLNKRNRNEDLEALADEFFNELRREGYCEYGGWGLDDKRPFGNSGPSAIARDILEIIGIGEEDYTDPDTWIKEDYEEYAHGLYNDLGDYIKKAWLKIKPNLKSSG